MDRVFVAVIVYVPAGPDTDAEPAPELDAGPEMVTVEPGDPEPVIVL